MTNHGEVRRATNSSAVLGLIYGEHVRNDHFSAVKHYLVHEYFHVLQGQILSGFTQLSNGEIAWDMERPGAYWLIEGLASYADYVYTQSRADRRPFLEDRYTPYKDLRIEDADPKTGGLDASGLSELETAFQCGLNSWFGYALSFVASYFLSQLADEDSYINYWKLLKDQPWEDAFRDAFGLSTGSFNLAFYEWLPSQLADIPTYDQREVKIS